MAILTHIDEVSPEMRSDLRNVYKDKRLKNKVSLIMNIRILTPKQGVLNIRLPGLKPGFYLLPCGFDVQNADQL